MRTSVDMRETPPFAEDAPLSGRALPVPERVLWADYAKGIAIFLVVLGHTLRGLNTSGILASGALFSGTDAWIYAFHIPAFFFLAGLFATRSASRPWAQFIAIKLKTLAYPYVVWAALQTLLQAAMSSQTNHGASLRDIARLPYDPPSQFWFIYALFGLAMLHAAATKLHAASWLLPLALVLYSINAWLYQIPWRLPHLIGGTLLYFAAGVLFADLHFATRLRRLPVSLLLGAAAAGYMLVLGSVLAHADATLITGPLCAFIGTGATLCLGLALERTGIAHFIAYWGQVSLQIYVAHVIISGAVRILLQKVMKLDQASIHLLLGVAAGIYGPILLKWASEKAGFKYLFSLRPTRADS